MAGSPVESDDREGPSQDTHLLDGFLWEGDGRKGDEMLRSARGHAVDVGVADSPLLRGCCGRVRVLDGWIVCWS